MTTISNQFIPGGARHPHNHRLWCIECHTDRFLVIESIESLDRGQPHLVRVSYTCAECDYFYEHPAGIPEIAAVLHRPGPRPSIGVLQFGGEYIHCGEPMHVASSELRNAYSTLRAETASDAVLDVYLQTRVLRCTCGFQMEIPD